MTQDAYTPYTEIDLPISAAEDMFVTPDGTIYVADTGNDRIVKLENFEVIASYGEEVLAGPTGIYVDDDGVIYVADAKSNTIVILDKDGNLAEPIWTTCRTFVWTKQGISAAKNCCGCPQESLHHQ